MSPFDSKLFLVLNFLTTFFGPQEPRISQTEGLKDRRTNTWLEFTTCNFLRNKGYEIRIRGSGIRNKE